MYRKTDDGEYEEVEEEEEGEESNTQRKPLRTRVLTEKHDIASPARKFKTPNKKEENKESSSYTVTENGRVRKIIDSKTGKETPVTYYDESKETNIADKTGKWREVKHGEAFEPGREFRMDTSTGKNYVKEE